MTRVHWEDLERTPLYEDMVAVLLSRLNPDAERIDGIGGDGGRDVQLRAPDRLDLFELKSFTGRVSARSPNRRSQIEASLRTAAALEPTSWTLVVPINHNESELAWFDKLREQCPFPLDWKDRDWLDDQMATFPDLRRYYVEGASDEVVRLLAELNVENAKPANVDQGMARLARLCDRVNQLDPHFKLELTNGSAEVAALAFPNAVLHKQEELEGRVVTVSVIPEYRDALRDRPIMLNTSLNFADTESGREAYERFTTCINYGDPTVLEPDHLRNVEIIAPGGIGGNLGPGYLSLGPPADETKVRIDAQLVTFDADGARLASVPIAFERKHAGQQGGVLEGQDAASVLFLSLRLNHVEKQAYLNLQVRSYERILPALLLPSLRVVHSLRRPNLAAIFVDGKKFLGPQPVSDMTAVTDEFVVLIQQVVQLQAATSTSFAIPNLFEPDDLAAVRRISRLIAGETLAIRPEPWEFTLSAGAPAWNEEMERGGSVGFEGQFYEELLGEQIPLGVCSFVASPVRLEREDNEDGTTLVRVVPLPDTQASVRRGSVRAGDAQREK